MAASWHGGSYTKICLAAALAGSVGLALYYGYKKRQEYLTHSVDENKQKPVEANEKKTETDSSKTASANSLPKTEELKSSLQPTTENIKEVFEVAKSKGLKISAPAEVGEKSNDDTSLVKQTTEDLRTEVTKKTEEVKSAAKSTAEDLKTKVKEKTGELQSSVKSTAEQLKTSIKSATEKGKEKAVEIKSSIDTSLTESSFSILGDNKEDKKDKELSTKDDNDIVVIEETRDKKGETKEESIIAESAGFAQSLPSASDQPQSLSAFELSSLETEPDKSGTSASVEQPQSLSTYEFPSLDQEKSKTDNGSDIEVLTSEDKSKHEVKPASDTPAPSHIPKAKRDFKKPGSAAASSSKVEPTKDTRETKSKGRKGSKDSKRKEETDSKDSKRQDETDGAPVGGEIRKKSKDDDETDTASGKSKKKAKDCSKTKPPPVPPKPKCKPETAQHKDVKDCDVHIRHPTNRGEFISFGMKFESQDSTTDHIITGVEDGGPASEVGLEDNDVILKVNDMDVTHWSRAVLLEQFRMIPSSEFDLTIKRQEQGKYFSVHIMDDEDGVAVSGVVIDVNSIPKSNLISLKTAEGPEAIQKCHVVSQSGACAQVTDQGLALQEKLVDDESFTFEKINYKDGDSNVVILKTNYKGSPVYITVLNRSTVGVQVSTDMFSTYDLEDDVTQLATADPRCFYLIKTRGGSFWLESTQFPDHYLCCKGNQFVLVSLTQASEVATNRDIRFKFEPI